MQAFHFNAEKNFRQPWGENPRPADKCAEGEGKRVSYHFHLLVATDLREETEEP